MAQAVRAAQRGDRTLDYSTNFLRTTPQMQLTDPNGPQLDPNGPDLLYLQEGEPVEGGSGFRLSIDAKASKAIEGMPPAHVSTRLMHLERLYLQWLGVTPKTPVGSRWGQFQKRLFFKPLSIIRHQVYELAMRCTRLENTLRAATAQAAFVENYLRVSDELREFRKFLAEHFPDSTRRGEALNTPVLDQAKQVMLGMPPVIPDPALLKALTLARCVLDGCAEEMQRSLSEELRQALENQFTVGQGGTR